MTTFSVRSLRGEVEETRHTVLVSVVGPETGRELVLGDVSRPTPMRSAAKPFQAIPALRAGVADRFDLTGSELALMCASHNSEDYQVDAVARLLDRIGCGPDDLVCRSHRPLIKDLGYPGAEPDAEIPLAPPSSLSSNCSGKHTGMLALARARKEPTDGYHSPTHDVQQRSLECISEFCEVPASEIGMSGDGCGVVCWTVPLRAIAVGYRALAADASEPVAAVRAAMMAHPEFVAGSRRLCTALMRAYPGQVLAKVGAGGVYGAALPGQGIGIAIKVLDGNSIAAGTALLAVLSQLDLLPGIPDALPIFATPSILNTRREVVGRYEAVGSCAWNG